MPKCLKLADPLSRNDTKNAKNSQVHIHEKVPKICRCAVTKKYQKVASQRAQKNTKMHRLAVMQKCVKLAAPLSLNDTKNAKNSMVRGDKKMPKSHRSTVREKCQKLAGLG